MLLTSDRRKQALIRPLSARAGGACRCENCHGVQAVFVNATTAPSQSPIAAAISACPERRLWSPSTWTTSAPRPGAACRTGRSGPARSGSEPVRPRARAGGSAPARRPRAAAAAAGRRGRARRRRRRLGRAAGDARARRAAAGDERQVAEHAGAQVIDDRDPGGVERGARRRGLLAGDAVGLLDERRVKPSARAAPVAVARSRAVMPPPAPWPSTSAARAPSTASTCACACPCGVSTSTMRHAADGASSLSPAAAALSGPGCGRAARRA